MQHAARRNVEEKRLQQLRGVERVSRHGDLVRDGLDLFLGERALHDAIHKARPIRAEHPRHTHRKISIGHIKHREFPCPLRFAVMADRHDRIVLGVTRCFCAVEHVVRADLNAARALRLADFREGADSMCIDPHRLVALRLAAVHVRLRGAVHEHTEIQRRQHHAHLLRLREIEFLARKAEHIEAGGFPFADERGTQTASGSGDDDERRGHLGFRI